MDLIDMEWRCGYCDKPWLISSNFCSNCGRAEYKRGLFKIFNLDDGRHQVNSSNQVSQVLSQSSLISPGIAGPVLAGSHMPSTHQTVADPTSVGSHDTSTPLSSAALHLPRAIQATGILSSARLSATEHHLRQDPAPEPQQPAPAASNPKRFKEAWPGGTAWLAQCKAMKDADDAEEALKAGKETRKTSGTASLPSVCGVPSVRGRGSGRGSGLSRRQGRGQFGPPPAVQPVPQPQSAGHGRGSGSIRGQTFSQGQEKKTRTSTWYGVSKRPK